MLFHQIQLRNTANNLRFYLFVQIIFFKYFYSFLGIIQTNGNVLNKCCHIVRCWYLIINW